ncbi:hypothetical protein SEA_MADAMATO_43 [Streptomyces phage Madamato]|nr:hypothetical protein SEA_MADAMATO_43 [Streptomyces phage Madamato]
MDEKTIDIPENDHDVEPEDVKGTDEVEETDPFPTSSGSINYPPSRFWGSFTIRIGAVMVALKAVDILGQIVLERERHRRLLEKELWKRSQS